MKLIGPLVLLTLISLVELEVVKDFAVSCPQFFLDKEPPTVLKDQNNKERYKQICQRLENKYRYATLYDTKNRIPVYSAYLYEPPMNKRPVVPWMIEPQLELVDVTEMTEFGAKQAVDDDYKGSGYTRGHLNPSCYNCGETQLATFTLTNIAPQTDYDNGVNWKTKVEDELKKKIEKDCDRDNGYKVFLVTGVIPGDTFIKKRVGKEQVDRVNIPSYYWTAFSCENKKQKGCMSGGYMLKMTKKTIEQMKKQAGPDATYYAKIDDLDKKLKEHYRTDFAVFEKYFDCLPEKYFQN